MVYTYNKLDLKNGTVLTADHFKHIEDGVAAATEHPWKGAKMGFMGDSITWGYDGTSLSSSSITPYWKLLTDMLGGSSTGNDLHAYGVNGSTIGVGLNQPMCNRVTNLDNTADIQFIFGGTNDFDIGNMPIGEQFVVTDGVRTLNMDKSTFYGGYNSLITTMMSHMPNATIVIMTPLHRGRTFDEGSRTEWESNSQGKFLSDYVAAIKNIASWFGIPVIDLYSLTPFYPQGETSATGSQYFLGNIPKDRNGNSSWDALHPNQLGHQVIAECIYKELRKVTPRTAANN